MSTSDVAVYLSTDVIDVAEDSFWATREATYAPHSYDFGDICDVCWMKHDLIIGVDHWFHEKMSHDVAENNAGMLSPWRVEGWWSDFEYGLGTN